MFRWALRQMACDQCYNQQLVSWHMKNETIFCFWLENLYLVWINLTRPKQARLNIKKMHVKSSKYYQKNCVSYLNKIVQVISWKCSSSEIFKKLGTDFPYRKFFYHFPFQLRFSFDCLIFLDEMGRRHVCPLPVSFRLRLHMMKLSVTYMEKSFL